MTLMRKWRLPVIFLIVGLGLKGLLDIGWRLTKSPAILRWLTDYDPISLWFADKPTALLFSPGCFGRSGEAVTFEVLLVGGFGMQCLVVGSTIALLLQMKIWRGQRPV